MKTTTFVLYLMCCLFPAFLTQGQRSSALQTVTGSRSTLSIGDVMPDVSLRNLINYSGEAVSLADLKGKLVILDFWTVYCSSCIAAMPEMEALQEQFDDRIQIIMVTKSTAEQVEKLAQRSEIVRNVKLPSLIGDTVFTRLFEFRTVPTHVWIDEEGIVSQFTGGKNTTEQSISDHLAGKRVTLPVIKEYWDFDADVSLLQEGGGRQLKHLQYYSVIMKRIDDGGGLEGAVFAEGTHKPIGIKMVNQPISDLFTRAFGFRDIGNKRVIFDVSEPERYIVPSTEDPGYGRWVYENTYCYESRVPADKTAHLKEIMQRDLELFFGLKGKIEKRTMPCLVLKRIDETKPLAARGGRREARYADDGNVIVVKNNPLSSLIRLIDFYVSATRPVVDETGHEGNIDIKLNSRAGDYVTLRKELHRYGLDLVEEERLVDVLVITEAGN